MTQENWIIITGTKFIMTNFDAYIHDENYPALLSILFVYSDNLSGQVIALSGGHFSIKNQPLHIGPFGVLGISRVSYEYREYCFVS